jgi:transcriptional regulator with XRE-family HTH domain
MTGEELKIWRKSKRLSQTALAKMLGVSYGFINKYEKLSDFPIPKKLLLLIQTLDHLK